MGRRVKRILGAVSLTLTVGACAAEDAGTPCHHDYHCISGSCTWGTCDGYASCWPACGEQLDDSQNEAPPSTRHDPTRPTLDASVCQLRLCAELSLAECRVEPNCAVSTRCSDAGVLEPVWTRPFAERTDLLTDGGQAAACTTPERCVSSSGSDVRVHPLNSCF